MLVLINAEMKRDDVFSDDFNNIEFTYVKLLSNHHLVFLGVSLQHFLPKTTPTNQYGNYPSYDRYEGHIHFIQSSEYLCCKRSLPYGENKDNLVL